MKFLPAIIKEGNDLNFVIYKDFSKIFRHRETDKSLNHRVSIMRSRE